MKSKMNYFAKIPKVVKQEGVYSLIRKIKSHLILRTLPFFDLRFDLKFGVDTCGTMFQGDESDIGFSEIKRRFVMRLPL